MLKRDWVSLMTRFGDQHGDNIHETRLPAQSYFESFEEALADGSLEAERLDQVVNVVEERAELAKTPNAAKHLGIHLDASLTIQTRRRVTSVLPATTEALRLKFSVMSNLWLLAKMRQPARQIFADFTESTFTKILDELLSEKNFLLDRNIAGTRIIVPKWEHCLEYEYQVRRQAIKLCGRKGFSFQSAWWSVYLDVEHRMEHAAVDHRELKLRPCSHPFGVSSSPQHGSGTASPGSRPPEAVSPVTLAQRWTRTRYRARSFEQTLWRTRKPLKEEFQQKKGQSRQRQRQERREERTRTSRQCNSTIQHRKEV